MSCSASLSSAAAEVTPRVCSMSGLEHSKRYVWLRPLFHLIAVKGLRRGEAVILPWANTRLTDAEADIRTQVVQLSWTTLTSTPKSEAGQRTITLDADTVRVLSSWKKCQKQARLKAGEGQSDSGLVFTRQDGTGWHPSHVSDRFARIARAAGLPPITLYGLRHGAASMAHPAGFEPATVGLEEAAVLCRAVSPMVVPVQNCGARTEHTRPVGGVR